MIRQAASFVGAYLSNYPNLEADDTLLTLKCMLYMKKKRAKYNIVVAMNILLEPVPIICTVHFITV